MKRATLYMAMAALAFASCSKNEVTDTPISPTDYKMIRFNSSTGTTRATPNDLVNVKGGFNVLGFKKDAATAFIDGKDASATYKFSDPNWVWESIVGKEWPTDDATYPLTFYAEYPKTDMSANAGTLNKAISVDLDMANQTDYLVAKSVVPTRPSSGFAPLNFKHILSNLVFKVETRDKYKVVVQSIRIVNTAKSGRTFDYKTAAYEITEPVYTDYASTDGTHKAGEGFFYSTAKWEFTGNAAAGGNGLIGEVPAANGILMQMPQLTIPYWVESNGVNGLGKFKADAEAWSKGTGDAAAKLDAWYTVAPGTPDQPGMNGSDGWKGARIEVIYRLYDTEHGKSIIGRQSGETYQENGVEKTAGKDYFIRVGYPLDLSAIQVANNPKGWEMNKRYTYTIQIGTAKATNGILLDPDYKDENGASGTPKVVVENPKANPGEPTTPGLISFIVSVDEWTEHTPDIPIH